MYSKNRRGKWKGLRGEGGAGGLCDVGSIEVAGGIEGLHEGRSTKIGEGRSCTGRASEVAKAKGVMASNIST